MFPGDSTTSAQPFPYGSTDEILLGRAVEGNNESWNEVVKIYGPLIYQTIRRSGIQPADAADITQTVLLDVLRSLGSFDRRQTGSFRKWLKVITRNKLIDFCRKRSKSEEVLAQPFFDLAEDSKKVEKSLPDDRLQALLEILQIVKNSVSETTWAAFEMTQAAVETSEEIGRRLGITSGAVRMARRRVLLQIELLFARYEENPE